MLSASTYQTPRLLISALNDAGEMSTSAGASHCDPMNASSSSAYSASSLAASVLLRPSSTRDRTNKVFCHRRTTGRIPLRWETRKVQLTSEESETSVKQKGRSPSSSVPSSPTSHAPDERGEMQNFFRWWDIDFGSTIRVLSARLIDEAGFVDCSSCRASTPTSRQFITTLLPRQMLSWLRRLLLQPFELWICLQEWAELSWLLENLQLRSNCAVVFGRVEGR
jgi:hypothetical protein